MEILTKEHSGKGVLPFSETDLAAFFQVGMECIGEGSRRKCFRVPDLPFCVKFYRLPSEYTWKTRPGVKAELALFRHSSLWNTSCQEWAYHKRLRKRLPPEIFQAFPEVVERVYLPDRGWGLVENLITNADGSPIRRVIDEIKAAPTKEQGLALYDALSALCHALVEHAVKFYDPPNIMTQWVPDGSFRLRIVDFEPMGRTFLPFLTTLPVWIRSKTRRRSERYLHRLTHQFHLDRPSSIKRKNS